MNLPLIDQMTAAFDPPPNGGWLESQYLPCFADNFAASLVATRPQTVPDIAGM